MGGGRRLLESILHIALISAPKFKLTHLNTLARAVVYPESPKDTLMALSFLGDKAANPSTAPHILLGTNCESVHGKDA